MTFADVAGCDEGQGRSLGTGRFPARSVQIQKLGGRIPRGVLMVGSPARAKPCSHALLRAGQGAVLSISGSDFVEMFVGVGAARVRDMFEQAKEEFTLHCVHRRN